MNSMKNIIVATALSATLAVAHLGSARAEDGSVTLKPLQGVSFHTGPTDAVAYFMADRGACNVVLTLTDEFDYAPTRFEAAIEAGKATRYEIAEGRSLEFTCQAAGQMMNVRSLEAVADETLKLLPGANWTRAGLGG